MASVCCALNSELHNIVCLQYSVFFHQFGPGGLGGKLVTKPENWENLFLLITIKFNDFYHYSNTS